MALVAIDIETKLYEAIAEAVLGGKYRSPQHFLEVAAWNQVALEESAERDAADRPARRGGDGSAESPATRRVEGSTNAGRHSTLDRSGQALGGVIGNTGAWRPMVRRVELPEVFPAPEPFNEPDGALWGQTNRVLPIAVGVRVLGHLLSERDGEVAASEWHQEATRVAIELREELRTWDEQAQRRHGTRWATAFPKDDPASAHRYVNQFLGMPRPQRLPDGGAAFLGFVSFDGTGEDARVVLTRSGAEWVSLENPIFDRDDEPANTFSTEETRFFLGHLRGYRTGEYGLLNAIAALVAAGHSRTEIDAALAHAYPSWQKYISTMRAGALGRLSDLGLLERTRRGLQVDYHLSTRAAELGLPDDQFERRP